MTVRDTHIVARVRIDAVGIAVHDGDAVNVHVIRAKQADVVVGRVEKAD